VWAVSKLRRATFRAERQCIEGDCCWPVVRQARDSVGRCEQLSSVVPTGATTALNNIGDVHDASPPSPFNFTSPPTRAAGWADQPAEVSDTSRRRCGGAARRRNHLFFAYASPARATESSRQQRASVAAAASQEDRRRYGRVKRRRARMNVFKSRRDAVPSCDERLFITDFGAFAPLNCDLSALQKHEHVRLMLSFIVAAIIVIINILVLFFNQFHLHNLLAFYVFCY